MATAVAARKRLSEDVGDEFNSTTTTIASGTSTLDDARLSEEEYDKLITKQASVWMAGSQTGGPSSDEERGIASKSGSILTSSRVFSVTLQASVAYELHRIFRATAKDAAITNALELCVPLVWKELTSTFATVAEQQEYDITADGYYQDTPHQVHLVSTLDTEITTPIYDWEMREGSKLHFGMRITTARTIRLYGIKKPAITDISEPQLGIITARAAMILYEQAINQVPNDQVGRFNQLLTNARSIFQERVVRHMITPMPKHIRTSAFGGSMTDINWGIT